MPLAEHSDPWGYNPRQFFSIHSLYGTPDDLRRLVDRAHGTRSRDACHCSVCSFLTEMI